MTVSNIGKIAPIKADDLAVKRASASELGKRDEFKQTLEAALANKTDLKFSNHAMDRLSSRGVNLNDQTVSRLDSAIEAAGKKGAWFDCLFLIIIPIEFFLMMGWWFWKAITVYDPHGWWNPLHTYSLGTCLFQWGVVLVAFLGINRYYLRKKKL